MRIAIFGASGATGRHLVAQALAKGHTVKALVRSENSLTIDHASLIKVVGELSHSTTVQSVIKDAHAVISVLGARKGGSQTICADGVRSILQAMLSTGVQRLIALSAYGASETRNASLYIRFVRSVISEKMRDKDAMEEVVRASTTQWTLVRPPMLTNAKAGGRYHSGVSMRPGITGRISREDLASFILNISINEQYIHQAPVVSIG